MCKRTGAAECMSCMRCERLAPAGRGMRASWSDTRAASQSCLCTRMHEIICRKRRVTAVCMKCLITRNALLCYPGAYFCVPSLPGTFSAHFGLFSEESFESGGTGDSEARKLISADPAPVKLIDMSFIEQLKSKEWRFVVTMSLITIYRTQWYMSATQPYLNSIGVCVCVYVC